MELRRVSYNTYDVFCGTQWCEHSRVRKTRNGTYVMSGNRLHKNVLTWLDGVLHPSLPITPGMTVDHTLYNLSHINRH